MAISRSFRAALLAAANDTEEDYPEAQDYPEDQDYAGEEQYDGEEMFALPLSRQVD